MPLRLNQQIFQFVERFQVVEERQVYQFFRKCWGARNVERALIDLKTRSYIFEQRLNPNDEEEPLKLSCTKSIRTSMLAEYKQTLAAISILCSFNCDEITYFDLQPFPSNIMFITTKSIIYEVSVYTADNWVAKFAMTQRARGRNLPDGEKDPTNYIAIVPHNHITVDGDRVTLPPDSMVRKLAKLGFNTYATVDRSNHAELYTF